MQLLSALALALGLMGSVNAFNIGLTRTDALFAALGLNNDGSPIELSNVQVDKRGPADSKRITQESVSLPLDHWDLRQGQFNNRMWVSDTNYKPGGPVFIYDVGEQDADGFEVVMLRGAFADLLKKFNGMGVVWEHRYYGVSTPVPITTSTPATAFKHHTSEQALADVAAMAWNFSRPNFPEQDLTPRGTPWVFVGGSYPGMRAAFMRDAYPGTIFASWASSAPVQASVDMSFYFEPIWRGMNKYGWGNCTRDIRATLRVVDKSLEYPTSAAKLKDQFLGAGASVNSNAGFTDALSTILYNWQSYNTEGGVGSLRSFCDWMATDPATNLTSPAEGWAATKGANFTMQRWITWPEWTTTVNLNMGASCTGPPTGSPPDQEVISLAIEQGLFKPITRSTCDLDGIATEPGSISWIWQYCTQWGYLQYANVGPHQLVGKWSDKQHTIEFCQKQFPDGLKSGLLPPVPKAAETNSDFGGWDIRPSQTFWTGGEFDPWRTLSPLSDMYFAPKIAYTQNIPQCAVPAPPWYGIGDYAGYYGEDETENDGNNGALFSFLVPDGEHCYDLDTGARGKNGAPARQLFISALNKWLPCFKPGQHNKGYRSAVKGGTGVKRALYP